MSRKFDPAPTDKHADSAKKATRQDRTTDELEKGLRESFPASDPASSTQPAKMTPDGD
jgi:hypothetical protein